MVVVVVVVVVVAAVPRGATWCHMVVAPGGGNTVRHFDDYLYW